MASRRIISVQAGADLSELTRRLQGLGLWATVAQSEQGAHTVMVEAYSADVGVAQLRDLPGVENVFSPTSKHPRVDSMRQQAVTAGGVSLGAGHEPVVMAGPCSVESEAQIRPHVLVPRLQALRTLVPDDGLPDSLRLETGIAKIVEQAEVDHSHIDDLEVAGSGRFVIPCSVESIGLAEDTYRRRFGIKNTRQTDSGACREQQDQRRKPDHLIPLSSWPTHR